jgi:hypothetical protein
MFNNPLFAGLTIKDGIIIGLLTVITVKMFR